MAKYVQEGTLNDLTQTEPVILFSLGIVIFNELFTIFLKSSNIYLIFMLQVPIKHKKRTDDAFLPHVAENVQPSAFQVQTAPSRIPFRPGW